VADVPRAQKTHFIDPCGRKAGGARSTFPLAGGSSPKLGHASVDHAARPPGFQTAEFMLEHGFVDRIVPRADLRREIARIIDYCGK